ncbi:hypothetical protein [Maricaulis parjimensis]|uniref:hypothetical protein n=1 Tax=Maricaulis parjimensis TaxID=144023 RepID=UPI0019396BB9|nr:hypothetical protein [Maricaulis parjimensis]
MAQSHLILAALTAALILPASALGQAVPDRVCTAQDIAEARAGTYTGPACRFSADQAAPAPPSAQPSRPADRLAGAPPQRLVMDVPARPALEAPRAQMSPPPARPVAEPVRERVVLQDDFFTGSLVGGVERPGFQPVYSYRGLILIGADGRVRTGFAGPPTSLTRQVRAMDRPSIGRPVITPPRAYPYN